MFGIRVVTKIPWKARTGTLICTRCSYTTFYAVIRKTSKICKHNVPASFPDVSLAMEICAQRTAGRRKGRLSPFSFPWSLALRHQSLAFGARLCSRPKCETKRLRRRQTMYHILVFDSERARTWNLPLTVHLTFDINQKRQNVVTSMSKTDKNFCEIGNSTAKSTINSKRKNTLYLAVRSVSKVALHQLYKRFHPSLDSYRRLTHTSTYCSFIE